MENNNYDFDMPPQEAPEEENSEILIDTNEEVKPKNHFKESKWFSQGKLKLYAIAGAAVAFVLIILFVSLYIKSDKVDKALDSQQYKRAQIVISQTVKYLNDETEEETNSEEETGSEFVSDDNFLGNYYYDENGELVTEEQEQASQPEDTSTSYDICTIKVDDDILYEKGDYGQSYRFTRDGERFVIYYYEDFLANIMKEEGEETEGEWIEVYEQNYGTLSSFDFSVFDSYVESDFKKVEDYYVPKGNSDEIFFDFLRVKQFEKYANQDMKLYFENGKISKIIASYTYDGTMDIVQTYKFTYNNEKITIPTPDKKYDINGNLIEGKVDEK